MASALVTLTIETAGTEDEAAESLEAALEMEVEVTRGDRVEGEEGGDGTQRALGDLEYITQDA